MEGNGYLTSRNPLICGSLLVCILLIHMALMAKFVSPGALYTLANFWLQNHRSGRVKIYRCAVIKGRAIKQNCTAKIGSARF
jgi:hypothetical protein